MHKQKKAFDGRYSIVKKHKDKAQESTVSVWSGYRTIAVFAITYSKPDRASRLQRIKSSRQSMPCNAQPTSCKAEFIEGGRLTNRSGRQTSAACESGGCKRLWHIESGHQSKPCPTHPVSCNAKLF
jgi:hypothetical protein